MCIFFYFDAALKKMDTKFFRKALNDIDIVFNENIKKVTKRKLKWEKV